MQSKASQSTKRTRALPQRVPEPDRDVVVPPAVIERLRLERRAAERHRLSAVGSILEASR
jgi:hypothetical protein